ncbi:family 16 glycosylhydrolase [Frankia sp. CNm7]|uniref:Family 16 glycosylhydrolase n=1 Tax=Frankia nepalensis TaxID=1836974 RepID=A0A937UTX6_9ACTN|nr:family 16 glycosylhydrolase [Frankia nepalensis]MBL7498627.1 family 16 glycosylhydrolase [Frankia nepalensis]MBL7515992.1 family 16 glycosylhydrolase [Frankia nepalensis]MBL7520036.1 family 16 glycosylhydrolase [Frankia nepalensis]MBL7630496.1 family 16 glycosylhydrolase [Frankia nepalensis]
MRQGVWSKGRALKSVNDEPRPAGSTARPAARDRASASAPTADRSPAPPAPLPPGARPGRPRRSPVRRALDWGPRLAVFAVLAVVVGVLIGPRALTGRDGDERTAPTAGPTGAVSPADPASIGRWRAGTGDYTDAGGLLWKPDAGVAVGGTLASTDAVVDGTGNPGLYQSQRVGALAYRLPVAGPGSYLVLFHLAETSGARAGGRVFDVTVDGRTAASGVDVAARVGPLRADWLAVYASTSTDLVEVRLVARAGSPAVAAVSASLVRSGTGPAATVWADEFDGPAGRPPGAAWTAAVGAGGWGNHELQYYTGRTANAALDGAGGLVLRASRESYTGADGVTAPYTSARLTTENSFSFTYGRIEARARIPDGIGLLPAIWAMGVDLPTAGWPEAGELDVVEAPIRAIGSIAGIVHGPDGTPAGYSYGGRRPPPADVASAFHTYAVDWYPDVIVYSVDSQPYAVVARADLAPGERWVFDKPFYLLFSLAVGGDWPGDPPRGQAFPQDMVIDYVRVTR